MAARLDTRTLDHIRSKIQTIQLVKRLQSFALSEDDPQTKRPVQMSADQVRAAVALVKKTVPDLAVTQHTGPDGGAIETSITVKFVGPNLVV